MALVLLGGLSVARPVHGWDTTSSALRAWPSEGRAGDTVFISGAGLRPNSSLFLMFACPNAFAQHVGEWGNLHITAPPTGPRTDPQGQFTAYPYRVPKLSHLTSSGCLIYVVDGTPNQPYGPAILGTYYILGPHDHSMPCDLHICLSVTPKPKRVKSGLYENVDIEGWGGATAYVTVTFPGCCTIHKTVYLDWNGSRRVSFQVPSNMADAAHVHVAVECKLGRAVGNRKAEFAVIH